MGKKDLGYIHLAVILFGLSGLFGKWINEPPVVIVFGRTFIAALFLAGLQETRKEEQRFRIKEHSSIVLQGILLAVHWVAFFHAIQLSSVAIALLTYSTFPLFTTFMEPLVFGTRLRFKDLVIAVFILAGVYLIFPDFRITNVVTQGALWGVFAGFSFALITLLNKRSVQSVTPRFIAFIQNITAAIVLAPFFFLKIERLTWKELLLLLLLGVVCTAIAQLCYIRSLKRQKAQLVSVMAALEPVYGILFALLILGEVPGVSTIAGGGLIVGSVVAASWTTDRQN